MVTIRPISTCHGGYSLDPVVQLDLDTYRPGGPAPDRLAIHHECMHGKHHTLHLLWLEYRQAHPEVWGDTQFSAHYRRWRVRQDVVMRLEHPAKASGAGPVRGRPPE